MVTNDFPSRANHELDSELANIVPIDVSHIRDLSPILSFDKKHRVTTSQECSSMRLAAHWATFKARLSTNPSTV